MYISPVHQRRTKSVFGIIAAVIFLLGLVGCERQTNDALEEYHNEDYGFSISVDKELMEYIEIEKSVVEDTQEARLDFYYVEEGADPSSDKYGPYLIWGRFFTIFIEPVGTTPQNSSAQFLGDNEQYSFYFKSIDTPIVDEAVRERYEQYVKKVNLIPSTFSIDK